MTDQEALELRKQLEKHYHCRVAPVREYCDAFLQFFDMPEIREKLGDDQKVLDQVRFLVVGKSCLLDRMIYGGEKPSQTPCPVHQGRWSGIHAGWPGYRLWRDSENGPVDEGPSPVSKQCQEWYDAGCRCFQHSCGCTTGWQPEEAK